MVEVGLGQYCLSNVGDDIAYNMNIILIHTSKVLRITYTHSHSSTRVE